MNHLDREKFYINTVTGIVASGEEWLQDFKEEVIKDLKEATMIIHNNILLGLLEEAYLTDNTGEYFYQAEAIDKYRNEYLITWEITNPEAQEEENACDWKNYTVEKL